MQKGVGFNAAVKTMRITIFWAFATFGIYYICKHLLLPFVLAMFEYGEQ